MVGELEGLVEEFKVKLLDIVELQEEIKKQTLQLKDEEFLKKEQAIEEEFKNTNKEENKLTQQRYNKEIAKLELELELEKTENENVKQKIEELNEILREKYAILESEMARKVSLRKENFENYFVISDEQVESRKKQIELLEKYIKEDEKKGMDKENESLKNRKRTLENMKASLDPVSREKELDQFLKLENILKSNDSIENKIQELINATSLSKDNTEKNEEIEKKTEKEQAKKQKVDENSEKSDEKPSKQIVEKQENNNEISENIENKTILDDNSEMTKKIVAIKEQNQSLKTEKNKTRFKFDFKGFWKSIVGKVRKIIKKVKQKLFPENKKIKTISAPQTEQNKNVKNSLRERVEVNEETKKKTEDVLGNYKLRNNSFENNNDIDFEEIKAMLDKSHLDKDHGDK